MTPAILWRVSAGTITAPQGRVTIVFLIPFIVQNKKQKVAPFILRPNPWISAGAIDEDFIGPAPTWFLERAVSNDLTIQAWKASVYP